VLSCSAVGSPLPVDPAKGGIGISPFGKTTRLLARRLCKALYLESHKLPFPKLQLTGPTWFLSRENSRIPFGLDLSAAGKYPDPWTLLRSPEMKENHDR